jgi:hypothetical protein
MRYLGKVIEKLPEVQEDLDKYKNLPGIKMNGSFEHIKTMLVREVVLRSAKHVFNRVLKEDSGESELHFNQIISHLLNCLFAPSFFREHLNSGKIKLADESIQNAFQFFPDASISSPRKGSKDFESPSKSKLKEAKVDKDPEVTAFDDAEQPSEDRPDESGLTKAQRKRLRAKQRKGQSVSPTKRREPKKEDKPKEMVDILFQQGNGLSSAADEFDVSDIFSSSTLSTGLHRLVPPHALSMTPEELFAEIRKIADTRFGYTIPDKLEELVCLQTVNNKTSLLRDVCKTIGIQLVD